MAKSPKSKLDIDSTRSLNLDSMNSTLVAELTRLNPETCILLSLSLCDMCVCILLACSLLHELVIVMVMVMVILISIPILVVTRNG